VNGRTLCTLCDLFDWDEDGVPTCAAFPGGIPADILHRGFDHRQEHPEDRGVRFVPRAGVTPEQIEQAVGVSPNDGSIPVLP
jgi:hypothetical protein